MPTFFKEQFMYSIFKNNPNISRLLLFYFFSIISIVIFEALTLLYKFDNGFQEFTENLFEKFIIIVVIAPLIETLIFNYFLQKVLSKFIKNTFYLIFISSLIFAFAHCHSIIYIFFGFFGGLILNLFYFLNKKDRSIKYAFWMTFLLHALVNLTSFIFSEFVK